MKNATCKKLIIDRSKATKVGTLKDISLFGSFTFPTEGQFANGLQLRPLAGVGNVVDKTEAQIEKLSGRQIPVAGATGASTSEEEPAPEPSQCPTQFPASRNEGYALKFIQHAPEQSVVASLHDIEVDQYLPERLESGFALKHGPGKRTVFSQAQKDIMIAFYNRQAVNRIRAEPRDVMRAMEDAGLEVLTATQIKSWWSTYHRKNRNLSVSGPPTASVSSSIAPSVNMPSGMPSAPVPSFTAQPSTVPSNAPTASVPTAASTATTASVSTTTPQTTLPSSVSTNSLFTTTPSATTPSSVAPAAVPLRVPTANMTSTTTPGAVPSSVSFSSTAAALAPVSSQAIVTGRVSQLSGSVIEWPFPADFSQSTIGGRNGSNACAFISLYFGQVASKGILPPRQGIALDVLWKDALGEAMT